MSTLRQLFEAAGFHVEPTGAHSWRLHVSESVTRDVRVVRRMRVTGNVRDLGSGTHMELIDVESGDTLWVPIEHGDHVVELAPDRDVTLTTEESKLIVDAAIAAGRSGPGVLIATVERVMSLRLRGA